MPRKPSKITRKDFIAKVRWLIRYSKCSLALLAQAATHQLKSRLPVPYRKWTARYLAEQVLTNMEGDLRVKDDTIIVTYYRDHQQLELAQHYQNLPQIFCL